MRKRLRSTIKWGCTVLTVLLLVVWVASGWWWWRVGLAPTSYHADVGVGLVQIGFDSPLVLERPESLWWAYQREPRSARLCWSFGIFSAPQSIAISGPLSLEHTWVSVPIWFLVLLVGVPSAFLWYRDRRHAPGLCIKCNYDLRGSVSGVCPECGTVITP